MQFFLDTLDIEEIRKFADLGMVDGITTNPSLVAHSRRDFVTSLQDICKIVKTSVSAEVLSEDYENMVREGDKLCKIAAQITIKVPLTPDGLKACRYFVDKGRKVNVTLCFSVAQALLAAKAGATFVSPFMGRLEDSGNSGIDLVQEIAKVYHKHDVRTLILAASIRNVNHVVSAFKVGADIVTMSPAIMCEMFKHPLTDKGLAVFAEDAMKSGMNIE